MAGADPTGLRPNAFVEANGAARETIERAFRLTPRSIALFAVFGVFVPALVYRGAVADFVRDATRRARARRDRRPRAARAPRDARRATRATRGDRANLAPNRSTDD